MRYREVNLDSPRETTWAEDVAAGRQPWREPRLLPSTAPNVMKARFIGLNNRTPTEITNLARKKSRKEY